MFSFFQYVVWCVVLAGISFTTPRGCLLSGYLPADKYVAAGPKTFQQCYRNHFVTLRSKLPSNAAGPGDEV